MTDSHYSQIYSVAIITVRRWRSLGRTASIPCPLADPVKMPDWWESMVEAGHLEKACPAGVLDAAERVAAAMPPDADDGDGAPTLETDGEITALLASIAGGKSFDYGDGLKIAERSVQVADLMLLRAIRGNKEKLIGPLQRRLGEAGDAYRALMRDRGKIQAEANETLPKHEVRTAMMELHSNIQRRFRQELKQSFPTLEEKAASREDWNEHVDALVDRICVGLTSTNFAAPQDE